MLIPHTRGFCQLHREIFFTSLEGVVLVPETYEGVLPLYYTLLGTWLMILTHGEVSLEISVPLRNVLDAFNPLRNVFRVFMSSTQLRVFLSCLDAILNFILHFLPSCLFNFFSNDYQPYPFSFFLFLFIFLIFSHYLQLSNFHLFSLQILSTSLSLPHNLIFSS